MRGSSHHAGASKTPPWEVQCQIAEAAFVARLERQPAQGIAVTLQAQNISSLQCYCIRCSAHIRHGMTNWPSFEVRRVRNCTPLDHLIASVLTTRLHRTWPGVCNGPDHRFHRNLPARLVNMIGGELPIATGGDRQSLADSVEKVGHGFHDRKVCA